MKAPSRFRGVAIRRCNPLEVAAMTILAKCPQFAQKHEAVLVWQSEAPQFESAHTMTAVSDVWTANDDGAAIMAAAAKATIVARRQNTPNP